MDQAAQSESVVTLGTIVEQVGWPGMLAMLLGIAVLVAGLVLGARRGTRGKALGLLAASLLVPAIAAAGMGVLEYAARAELVALGAAVTPRDVWAGSLHRSALLAWSGWAFVLALLGSGFALWRSER